MRHAVIMAWSASLTIFLATAAPSQTGTKVASPALEFTERVVAGGSGDLMEVRHMLLRGDQRSIGRKLAEIARARHGVGPIDHDSDIASARRSFYEKWWPAHAERSRGVAAAFGLKAGDSRDTTALPYNMPPGFACSVAYYPPSHCAAGHAILSRNYDFSTLSWSELFGRPSSPGERRTTADPYVLEIHPDRGNAALYVSAYELLGGALEGVNSKGLTVALLSNNLKDARPAHGWRAGLGELEIVRYVLETCGTVEEARQALAKVPAYYCVVPCHYIVGDKSGRSFVWEYTADLSKRFVTPGKGEPQWVTNHPLHLYPSSDAIPPSTKVGSFRRFLRLGEEIARAPMKRSLDEVRRANSCVRAEQVGGAATRTLWHSIHDCEKKSLEVDFLLAVDPETGKERRSGYVKFTLGARSPKPGGNVLESIDGVIDELYRTVSFPAGEGNGPDWKRLRELVLPEAVFVQPVSGKDRVQAYDLEGFIQLFQDDIAKNPGYASGFREKVASRQTRVCGDIAHSFIVFEVWMGSGQGQYRGRGLDSIQLVKKGERWWVASITTQHDRRTRPIPASFINEKGKR